MFFRAFAFPFPLFFPRKTLTPPFRDPAYFQHAKIRLLPSGTWNGIVMKGGDLLSPWLMQEWAASVAEEGTRVLRLVLYGSGTYLQHDMAAIFKNTCEHFGPTSRRVAAFQVGQAHCLISPVTELLMSRSCALLPP